MKIQSKGEITHFIVYQHEIWQLYWSDLSVDWGIIHGIYSTVSNTLARNWHHCGTF